MDAIDKVRTQTRSLVRHVAIAVNSVSQGKITPDMVTLAALVLHAFIAWLIINHLFAVAGAALIVFGLFDSLDGELARVQQKESDWGMILDATSDRLKEGILYFALAYWFFGQNYGIGVFLALAALISSYAVSYIKAKAETVIAASKLSAAKANKFFAVGLARYELRMAILVLGLFFNVLNPALTIISVLSFLTLVQRAVTIRQAVN